MNFQRSVLIIALIGTLFAVCVQEYNLTFLGNRYPSRNGMLTSADEASYFVPVENWLKTGEWKDNSPGNSSYYQRPPGYGLLFLFCKILGGKSALLMLKWLQITAFGGAILLVGKLASRLISHTKIALLVVVIYALLPCFHGFMYFTLTESITPFLLLWTTLAWLNTSPDERIPWKLIISASILLIVRPQLIIILLCFLLAWIVQKRVQTVLFSLLLLIPLLGWNIRSYLINQNWTGIHPIYSETNNTLYRPSHQAMTDLFRIWEADGAHFHETIELLTKDTSAETTDQAIQHIPLKFRSQVKPIFASFQRIHANRITDFSEGQAIHSPIRGEALFMQQIKHITHKLIASNKLTYYLFTPLQSAKKLLLNSHLNLGVFQFKWRGFWAMEFVRWACLLLLIASYFATVLCLFNPHKETFWIALGICISIVYLVYIQRLNEERYLTPLLPLCLLLLGSSLSYSFFSRKK